MNFLALLVIFFIQNLSYASICHVSAARRAELATFKRVDHDVAGYHGSSLTKLFEVLESRQKPRFKNDLFYFQPALWSKPMMSAFNSGKLSLGRYFKNDFESINSGGIQNHLYATDDVKTYSRLSIRYDFVSLAVDKLFPGKYDKDFAERDALIYASNDPQESFARSPRDLEKLRLYLEKNSPNLDDQLFFSLKKEVLKNRKVALAGDVSVELANDQGLALDTSKKSLQANEIQSIWTKSKSLKVKIEQKLKELNLEIPVYMWP